jgi:hypothetical protein
MLNSNFVKKPEVRGGVVVAKPIRNNMLRQITQTRRELREKLLHTAFGLFDFENEAVANSKSQAVALPQVLGACSFMTLFDD